LNDDVAEAGAVGKVGSPSEMNEAYADPGPLLAGATGATVGTDTGSGAKLAGTWNATVAMEGDEEDDDD
jgi:hypothetical protein